MLYEGISRPRRLTTLTILILLGAASLGILFIMSFFFVLIVKRILYIFSHQPKRATAGYDNNYYNHYQYHRCRFDSSTGVVFSKIHKGSRIGTQQSIYDGRRYLHRICSSYHFFQYIVHCAGHYSVSRIIYLHAKFGPYKCTCP